MDRALKAARAIPRALGRLEAAVRRETTAGQVRLQNAPSQVIPNLLNGFRG